MFDGVKFSHLRDEQCLLRESGRMASKDVEMIQCEGEARSQMQPTLLPALPKFACRVGKTPMGSVWPFRGHCLGEAQ